MQKTFHMAQSIFCVPFWFQVEDVFINTQTHKTHEQGHSSGFVNPCRYKYNTRKNGQKVSTKLHKLN